MIVGVRWKKEIEYCDSMSLREEYRASKTLNKVQVTPESTFRLLNMVLQFLLIEWQDKMCCQLD